MLRIGRNGKEIMRVKNTRATGIQKEEYLLNWDNKELNKIFNGEWNPKDVVKTNFVKCVRHRFHYSITSSDYQIYNTFSRTWFKMILSREIENHWVWRGIKRK